MSKLEEVKRAWNRRDWDALLDFKGIDWLIEQADKIERYEEAIKTFLDSEPESGEDWEMFVESIKGFFCGILEGNW